jgi:tetratricopeptide (TPR) repeat protein
MTKYNIFIACPQVMKAERRSFYAAVKKFSEGVGKRWDVEFEPNGSETAIRGASPAQERIDDRLRKCKFAIFVFREWWGAPTPTGHSSWTAGEWELVMDLYRSGEIWDILLYFGDVDEGRLRDPGPQLQKVIEFQNAINHEGIIFYENKLRNFENNVIEHLADWTKFSTHLDEFRELRQIVDIFSHADAKIKFIDFCVSRIESIESHLYLFPIKELVVDLLYEKGKILHEDEQWDESALVYDSIFESFYKSLHISLRKSAATALLKKAEVLFDKSKKYNNHNGKEEICALEKLIFNFEEDNHLMEYVCRAMISVGEYDFGLQRYGDALISYNNVINRFGKIKGGIYESAVVEAFFGKGSIYHQTAEIEEELNAYSDLISKIRSNTGSYFRERLSQALFQKAEVLRTMSDDGGRIAVYNETIELFGKSSKVENAIHAANAFYEKIKLLYNLNSYKSAINNCIEATELLGKFNDISVVDRMISIQKLHNESIMRLNEEATVDS